MTDVFLAVLRAPEFELPAWYPVVRLVGAPSDSPMDCRSGGGIAPADHGAAVRRFGPRARPTSVSEGQQVQMFLRSQATEVIIAPLNMLVAWTGSVNHQAVHLFCLRNKLHLSCHRIKLQTL